MNQALWEVQNQLGPNFEQLFQGITSDNGSEFYGLTELLNDRVPVYFAHPYSSRERGTNERQNGMIRRFIPKGTELRHISELTVKRVQQWMNRLPRKILGYATPYEAFLEEMSFLELVASTI
ncbi:MAG: IS30 family transposase [Enterococcus sp.]|nr:IS30 family transposase [Enterococcus sp.]